MNKKDNVFKIWWYTYIFIPSIFIFISIILFFDTGWTRTDTSILGWLIIFLTSMFFQIYLLYKNNVKYRFEHYMYICLAILISIFISFIFTEFVFTNYDYWYQKILPSFLPPIILAIIKIILWFILNWKNSSHQIKDTKLEDLQYQNKLLSAENNKLREKCNSLNQDYQLYQNHKFREIQNVTSTDVNQVKNNKDKK